jgi:hypothetical protein
MNICVLGDSHSQVFNLCSTNEIKFDVQIVPGATAQGCVNPNSMTNSLEIYKSHIMKTNKYDKIMIMLGEVDCGYLIWVRCKRYNISIESQIDLCIKNINTFINDVLLSNDYINEQIVLCGVHLPTIKDNTNHKYLCGARKEVDVGQYERTLKTLEYNSYLKKMAEVNGYKYIDITKYIIQQNGLVNDYYLSSNVGDHHLDDTKISDFWKYEIKKILEIL